ncbi:uncharacterized protein BX663DRAFT_503079 [Cokeromyces recurvatus]|uniref:uncharacterized protein n=1 Tax=Cokeromyces recurvatus TaxID=90255 RepID=UPI00221FE0CF|nr:uncharacterized protein BX663DRAFT_503079 [Cokeromyces recurvatus]KAI7904648.1 hypothetical protein BX663DRAFT_503079 [Cokeromyces recurvatus]
MAFQVVLREGIVGGFAGPTVKQIIDLKGDDTGASIMQASLKAESKTDYHTKSGGVSIEQISNVLDTLKQKLQTLPTEEPVGSEDIYGQDISLSFFSDDFQWSNGGPEGCCHGESSVKATPEQKEEFKKLVNLVKSLGQEFAQ